MGAISVAENIRGSVEQCAAEWSGATLKATVTIGIATRIPARSEITETDSLTKGADSALYQAKKNGRNRISVSDNGVIELVNQKAERQI